MKICVVGYSGAGKSTLAEILGKRYGLPVLHMDATYWYGDWQSRTVEEQTGIVETFLRENSGWVIDGNYTKISPQRFADCDKLFFLDYNRIFCFFSALGRYFKNRGRCRGDCPCVEKFDAEFIGWLLYGGRTRLQKSKYAQMLNSSRGEKLVFRSRRRLKKYLKTII